MGQAQARMPAQAHFLSNKDCMAAFELFDKDDTGMMEFPEMQEAFNVMLSPATVDISNMEGMSFTPSKFRDVAEDMHRTYPTYDVAGNIMKYVKENREKQDDDGVDITDKALKKVFDGFDADGTGEFSLTEMFKLFEFLKIPIRFLFDQKGALDGTVTFDEFCEIIRSIDKDHPDLDVDDKIMGIAANIAGGAPDLSGEADPDPDNDPNDQDEEEDDPPNKKALLVGINYIGSSCELGGCINDVRNQMRILQEHFGFSEENILLLTEDQDDDSKVPKAEVIREGFKWLIDGASEGDFLVFAYSGHGSQLPCKDGSEPDGKNEILCPLDLQEDWYANSISDNYLFDTFMTGLPDGVKCLCIYDCCHSGTMADLSCTRDFVFPGEEEEEPKKDRFLEPGDEIKDAINAARDEAQGGGLLKRTAAKDLPDVDKLAAKLLWTISGCQDNQTSADATIGGQRQGAMTWSLVSTLEEQGTKGAWHWKYDKLLTAMRKKLKAGGYSQVPAMATTADQLFNRYYMCCKP